ncbi:MAG: DUF5640 domain-containing protein [Defluviitaleaceae bacterium]|nr:DUF5640 domain-containing protein [Defluviitaleaceae bacterium]
MKSTKKIFMAIAVLTMAAGLLMLTGCGLLIQHDEELVGTWYWNADGAYRYTFNADGTGERGFPETHQTFTWSTLGDLLVIYRDHSRRNEIANESWDFEIVDDVLTIRSHHAAKTNFSYVRGGTEQNEALVGRWRWDTNTSYIYTFHEDGTGTRNFPAPNDTFTWSTHEDTLFITRDTLTAGIIRGEIWTFELGENTITITSQQTDEAPSLVYNRIP